MNRPVPPKELKTLPLQVVNQSLALATSAFGLAAALAWNETIKIVISTYIQPYLGKDSGVISQLVYALLVTALAVIITMQLTRAKELLERQMNADTKALKNKEKLKKSGATSRPKSRKPRSQDRSR